MKKCLFYLFALLVVLTSMISFPNRVHALSEKGYAQLHSFAEILHQVEESYVEEVDEKKLILGSIRGMLATLDPHTVYMPPEVYRELKVESVGRFGGVGIEVAIKGGTLTVIAPIVGSPAEKAGIRAGDHVVRINGVSTKGLDLGEAVTLMRGSVGSRITITVVGKDGKHPVDISLIRRVIKIPSITMDDLGDGYIYAQVSTFQERTAAELKDELKKFSDKGEIKGLLIDLRNNPGGLLGQAIEVADIFVDSGVIVSTRSRGKEIARYDAASEGTQPKYPIVILVNGGSASASEILAGALKDYDKAILVGTQTFGKGSVQSVMELEDGSALKITIAKYYTPAGTSIQGLGITPNVVVEEGGEEEKGDLQKDAAISYLKDEAKYNKALQGMRKHHR